MKVFSCPRGHPLGMAAAATSQARRCHACRRLLHVRLARGNVEDHAVTGGRSRTRSGWPGRRRSAVPIGLSRRPVVSSMRVGDFGKGNNWSAHKCGIHFTLTPGGFWHVYRSPPRRAPRRHPATERPETGRWYAFRSNTTATATAGSSMASSWRISASRISWRDRGLVRSPRPARGRLRRRVRRLLESQGDVSLNFIQNACLKVYDIVPCVEADGISTIPPERFWARWASTRTRSGMGVNRSRWCPAKESAGFHAIRPACRWASCTFSVYLKADRPICAASCTSNIHGPWKHQEVRVGTDWACHAFTVDSPSN